MERGLSLLIATVILFVASGVQAQLNLSYFNNTQLNINNTGCGVSKLCLSTPSQCDPAGNSTCLFGSVRANTSASNGATVSFQLSGNSSGYIALGLSVNANQATALLFVCGQNSSTNGTFFFNAVQWNSSASSFPQASVNVTDIQGNVNGTKIQCAFTVPGLNSTTMTRSSNSATNFAVFLGSGNVIGTTLGGFSVTLNSGLLNIADPTANLNTTTTAPTTNTTVTATGAGGALHPHAVTLLLSVVTLCALKMV